MYLEAANGKLFFVSAAAFDLDGVLADTESIHLENEKEACAFFGLKVPSSEWEGFRGRTAMSIAKEIIGKYGNGNQINPEAFVSKKVEMYMKKISKVQAIPGSKEFVMNIRKFLPQIALTTSGKRIVQEKVLEVIGLADVFDVTITADDVSNGKPHPEPYLKTAELLSCSSGECLIIEDSDNGIISAIKAGCIVAGITTSFSKDVLYGLGAHIVVDCYDELWRNILRNSMN